MSKKLITVICYANYCRSPVAKELLEHNFGEKFNFDSAGIAAFNDTGMDPRSYEFLSKNTKIKPQLHIPKNINESIIKESFSILAMDNLILSSLNKKFKKYRKKFKLINFSSKNEVILDPYKYDQKEYLKTMKTLNDVIEDMDFDLLCV